MTTLECVMNASNAIREESIEGLTKDELAKRGEAYGAAGYNVMRLQDGTSATEMRRESGACLRQALAAYLDQFDEIWIVAPLNRHLPRSDWTDDFDFAVTPDAWLGVVMLAGLDKGSTIGVRIRGPTGGLLEYDSPSEWMEDVTEAERAAADHAFG